MSKAQKPTDPKPTVPKTTKKSDQLNIKQLVRDASAGKLGKEKFTSTLTEHYKSAKRDEKWIKKRIDHLWKETGKGDAK